MSSDDDSGLFRLPTEVLEIIFTLLPAKDFILCRSVCARFKQIVDGLSQSDALWQDYCKNDFGRVYEIARRKAGVGMHWFNIYKSLSLWPKLSEAREVVTELVVDGLAREKLKNFRILRDGIIAVHNNSAIVYYNIETMVKSQHSNITGSYSNYIENENTVVVLSCELHLSITRKVIKNPTYKTNVIFDNVRTFILVDREVYYANFNEEIYVCDLDDRNLSHRLVCRSNNKVMCLGYSNQLNVLTSQRDIYSAQGKELVYRCNVDPYMDVLLKLREYNFLEHVDWINSIEWMYYLNQPISPKDMLPYVTVFRIYGDIVFVGTYCGDVLIYYSPFQDGEFNPFNSKPVKEYNLSRPTTFYGYAEWQIIQIDVVESINGHMVIVATDANIYVLNFSHNFKRLASMAMLPNEDVQEAKKLKTVESQ